MHMSAQPWPNGNSPAPVDRARGWHLGPHWMPPATGLEGWARGHPRGPWPFRRLQQYGPASPKTLQTWNGWIRRRFEGVLNEGPEDAPNFLDFFLRSSSVFEEVVVVECQLFFKLQDTHHFSLLVSQPDHAFFPADSAAAAACLSSLSIIAMSSLCSLHARALRSRARFRLRMASLNSETRFSAKMKPPSVIALSWMNVLN